MLRKKPGRREENQAGPSAAGGVRAVVRIEPRHGSEVGQGGPARPQNNLILEESVFCGAL